MLRSLIIGLGSMIVIALAMLAFQERHRIDWPAFEIAWPDIELPRFWEWEDEEPQYKTEVTAQINTLQRDLRAHEWRISALQSKYDDLQTRNARLREMIDASRQSSKAASASFNRQIDALSGEIVELKSAVKAFDEDNTTRRRDVPIDKRLAGLEQRLEALSNRHDSRGGSSPSLKESASDHNSSNDGSDIGISIEIRRASSFGNVAHITSINSNKFFSNYALNVGDVIIRINGVFINSISLFVTTHPLATGSKS